MSAYRDESEPRIRALEEETAKLRNRVENMANKMTVTRFDYYVGAIISAFKFGMVALALWSLAWAIRDDAGEPPKAAGCYLTSEKAWVMLHAPDRREIQAFISIEDAKKGAAELGCPMVLNP